MREPLDANTPAMNRRFTAKAALASHFRIVDGLHVAFDRWPPPMIEQIVKAEEAASVAAVQYIGSGSVEDEIGFRRSLVAAEKVWREAAAHPPKASKEDEA